MSFFFLQWQFSSDLKVGEEGCCLDQCCCQFVVLAQLGTFRWACLDLSEMKVPPCSASNIYRQQLGV